MQNVAYEIGATLAYEKFASARFLNPKVLGLTGATVGGVYGLTGDITDPNRDHTRRGFMRGATLHGLQGLGAGLGAMAAKGMGINRLVGLPLGLLLGNTVGRSLVGPDRGE